MKRALRIVSVASLSVTLAYFGFYYSLRASLPAFSLHPIDAESDAREGERSLPFFGLMTPVPKAEGYSYVPKLEYRQGPPKRYLSRISFLLVGEGEKPGKERIEYYGRRTLGDWLVRYSKKFARAENWTYAGFVQASLEFAAEGKWPEGYESPFRPAAKLLFLLQAKRALGNGSTDVYVMDQAGIPAFLFLSRHRASIGEEAKIWFLRRNTLYEMRFASDGAFRALDPKEIFRRSFLVENRRDALAFVASELSDVKLNTGKLDKLSFSELEWPLLLLGAKLSIDPSSIHAFFHFAGLNALLFREHGKSIHDLEIVDNVRNNVLVSERYGRDVAPESEQSNEMGRLARALVQMLQ